MHVAMAKETIDAEKVEGERTPAQVIVLIDWPSKELAEEFYDSEEYRPYREARGEGARNQFVLVAGEDYILVDPIEGLIYFPTNTTADTAHSVTCTYKTIVGSQSQVAGAVLPQILGRLRFVPDPTDGQKLGVEAWRVNLYPAGQLGLIADDYGNWTLDGELLDDTANHPLSPYYLQTFY